MFMVESHLVVEKARFWNSSILAEGEGIATKVNKGIN